MAGFDPDNILQNAEQQAKEKADSAIDELASRVPGGEQLAQQAKDTVNQGIDQAGQAGMQQAEQQLGGMLGGQGSDPNAGNQGS